MTKGKIKNLTQTYNYISVQMHELISKKIGFSATDHKYLGFFIVKGKLTAKELGELTGLSSGAVTGLIDRFEQKQLVKREFDLKDRRKVFINPDSNKILKLLEPYYQEYQNNNEKLIKGYSKEENEIIQSFLEKSIEIVKNNIEKIKNDGIQSK